MDVAELVELQGFGIQLGCLAACPCMVWDWGVQWMFQCSELKEWCHLCPWISRPSAVAFCFHNPRGQDRPQLQPHCLMLGCKPASSAFCFWGLRTGKMHFLRGFNPDCMGGGCCVCLVWHRICLISFSVSVALSLLRSVNLNVITWPNHYKSGFVRIFSYKAGAVQGYLLCSSQKNSLTWTSH